MSISWRMQEVGHSDCSHLTGAVRAVPRPQHLQLAPGEVGHLGPHSHLRGDQHTDKLSRLNWKQHYNSPHYHSQGLFAAANIFSSLKLVYIFSVNPHLGPLQVTPSTAVSTLYNLILRFPSVGWSSIFVNFVFCIFWCSSHSPVVRMGVRPTYNSPLTLVTRSVWSVPNIILIYTDLPPPNTTPSKSCFQSTFHLKVWWNKSSLYQKSKKLLPSSKLSFQAWISFCGTMPTWRNKNALRTLKLIPCLQLIFYNI